MATAELPSSLAAFGTFARSLEETLRRGVALREHDETHRRPVLVFPTELKEALPHYPGGYALAVAFRFAGPVRGIYASLVVKLIYSIPFQKRGLYQNAAVFAGPRGAICGMAIELPDPGDDSIGRLTAFFGEGVGKDTRLLFLRYVRRQIDEMAFEGSVERQRIYHCGECDLTIEQRAVERARRDGRTAVACPVCTRAFPLDDLAEEATQPDANIETIETDAAAAQERESRPTVIEERLRRGQFHVFLCHHSRDKAAVRELVRALEDEGILPWLDEERIFAGFGNANIAGNLCFAVKSGLAAPSPSNRLPRNGIAPEERVPKVPLWERAGKSRFMVGLRR